MEETLTPPTAETSPHPFEREDLLDIVRKYAPEYVERLKAVTRPQLSSNPSDMEKWEAEQIVRRKKLFYGESNFNYLVRVLYEETFSVNQFPEHPYKESNGLTPGGLISHYLCMDTINGVGALDVAKYDLAKETLLEALKNEPDYRRKEALLRFASEITYPWRLGFFNPIGSREFLIISRLDKFKPSDELETYGYRLLKMLKGTPELRQPIKDEGLRNFIGLHPSSEMALASGVSSIWHKLGKAPGPLFTENGMYKVIFDDEKPSQEVIDALKNLLFVRTHPDLQVIYRYFSPSGYLTSQNKTSPTA